MSEIPMVDNGALLSKKLKRFVSLSQALLIEELPEDFGVEDESKRTGYSVRPRTRKTMNDIFQKQGPLYVRRAYRMTVASFWSLHKLLKSEIGDPSQRRAGSMKQHKNGAQNGLISSSVRLSAALWYFAGCRPDDIALVHGI
jgi:hypothetical protein